MKSFVAIVVVAAGLMACSRSTMPAEERPAQAPPEKQPLERSRMRAPYVLTLEGPSTAKSGETIEVIARLALHTPAPIPLVLSIEVPDGTAEIDGASTEELPSGTEGTIERRWKVQVLDPATVTVTAQMQGEGFGATARKELDFGEPKEAPAPNARPGMHLQPTK